MVITVMSLTPVLEVRTEINVSYSDLNFTYNVSASFNITKAKICKTFRSDLKMRQQENLMR